MRMTYDAKVDSLRILFREDIAISESDEEKPGVIIDYDSDGHIVGLEILDASKQVNLPEDLASAGVEAL